MQRSQVGRHPIAVLGNVSRDFLNLRDRIYFSACAIVSGLRLFVLATIVSFCCVSGALSSVEATNQETLNEVASEFAPEREADELLLPAVLPTDNNSLHEDAIINVADVDGLAIDTMPGLSNEINTVSLVILDWQWVLLILVGLIAMCVILKPSFVSLLRSRNLIEPNNNVFEPQALPEISAVLDAKDLFSGQVVPQNQVNQTITAVDHNLEVALFEEVEQGEFDVDDSMELVSVDEIEGQGEYNMTFDERFSRLIEDKDYVFARELLDFARFNEIEDERYHCERLRLLMAMRDEGGFHEYYNKIEARIPSFPIELQTEISQFVVRFTRA